MTRTWATAPVQIQVPATTANLGPGFDSLGLALTLYDEIEAAVVDSGLSVEVSGEGEWTAEAGEDHLVVRAMRAAFSRWSAIGQPPGLSLRCKNRIPHGRGLGSSAAAIVAGVLAARALMGEDRDTAAELDLASEMEGHPDNVAACLVGGLTVAWTSDVPHLASMPVVLDQVVAFVPDTGLSTEAARGVLPAEVPHRDAAQNAGRAALLVAVLLGRADPGLLMDATVDLLHQPYRAEAMPESSRLIRRLRERGVPAVVSGAGPTVLAFTSPSRADSIGRDVGNGWSTHPLNVDPHGARVQTAGQ